MVTIRSEVARIRTANPSDAEGPSGDLGNVQVGDLSTPTQVHDLVIAFYREIVFDELLEPVFGEVAEVAWAEHIPLLIDYWCHILFRTGPYAGSVTNTHRHLHGLAPIRPEHCDRWYTLWVHSIDQRWAGPHADHAARHAATLMAGLAKRVFGFEWVPPATGRDIGPGS